jgi:hypothetical protein
MDEGASHLRFDEDGAYRVVRCINKRDSANYLSCYLSHNERGFTMRVFLGGTCNESTWRQYLIKMLKIDYFDPVVNDWNEEAYQRELFEREHCDFVLYTITPKMTGVYSIAEVVDDSNKRPEKTIFCILREDDGETFTEGQARSLVRVGQMINKNGGKVFHDLEQVADYLNRSL